MADDVAMAADAIIAPTSAVQPRLPSSSCTAAAFSASKGTSNRQNKNRFLTSSAADAIDPAVENDAAKCVASPTIAAATDVDCDRAHAAADTAKEKGVTVFNTLTHL
jgi:hypothetical protein